MSIKGSCIESCWVRWLSLALYPTGIARHCAVGFKLLATIRVGHCFHNDKVDRRVSRSPDLRDKPQCFMVCMYLCGKVFEIWSTRGRMSWPIARSRPIKTDVVISASWPYLRVCCGHIRSHPTTFDVPYLWCMCMITCSIPMGDQMNQPLGHTCSSMLKCPAKIDS